MKTKTERTYITVTVPRSTVLEYDGVYFHEKGIEMEESVTNDPKKNVVNATFEGFEVLSDQEQRVLLDSPPENPSITAKLYYYIDIAVD